KRLGGMNLFVSPVSATNLPSLLTQQGGSITLGATSASSLDNILKVVSDPQLQSATGSISLTLAGGVTYQQTDSSANTIPFTVSAPAGVTLTISCPSGDATVYDLQASGGNVDIHGTSQGSITIIGQSPALTVSEGHVTVGPGVTLVTQ